MSKLTDTLKQALAKKKNTAHPENDALPASKTTTKKPVAPVISGKPVKKAVGRGG